MSATLKDVATLAGVSSATASRVLSGNPATSSHSRTAVTRAAQELNFLPNAQARSLRSMHTNTVGLLISDLRNPYFADLAHAVEQEARSLGLVTLIGSAAENAPQQDDFIKLLISHNIDGLIMVPQGKTSGTPATEPVTEALLTTLTQRKLPTIFIDRDLENRDLDNSASTPAIPSITANTQGLTQAVDHLVNLGHRRIAFLSGPATTSTGANRRTAFESACHAHALPADPALYYTGDFQLESGSHGARYFLNRFFPEKKRGTPSEWKKTTNPERPTALIIADSPMTIGALSEFHAAGLNIPQELSLVAYDDIDAYTLNQPALTTISHNVQDMGRRALHLLRKAIRGEPTHSESLPTALTIRASTAPPTQPLRTTS